MKTRMPFCCSGLQRVEDKRFLEVLWFVKYYKIFVIFSCIKCLDNTKMLLTFNVRA